MKAFLLLGVLLMVPLANAAGEPAPQRDGRFHNQASLPQDGVLKKLRIGLKYLFVRKPPQTRPATLISLTALFRARAAGQQPDAVGVLGDHR